MNEFMGTLKIMVDDFFSSSESRTYIKPDIPPEICEEVNCWYPVTLPEQIAIYRKSGFANLDEGYSGEKPVLIINRHQDYRSRSYGSQ